MNSMGDVCDDSAPELEPTQVDKKLLSQVENDQPFPRRHAWRSPDSPISCTNPRKIIPPIEAPSEQSSRQSETCRSHRTSELSTEWYVNCFNTGTIYLKY